MDAVEEQEEGKNEKRETPALSHLCEVQGEIIFTGVFPTLVFPCSFFFWVLPNVSCQDYIMTEWIKGKPA